MWTLVNPIDCSELLLPLEMDPQDGQSLGSKRNVKPDLVNPENPLRELKAIPNNPWDQPKSKPKKQYRMIPLALRFDWNSQVRPGESDRNSVIFPSRFNARD